MTAREAVDAFSDSNVTHVQIGTAVSRIFVLLYGGKDTDNLSSIDYAKYMKMASTTPSITPEKLPPTERAARLSSKQFCLLPFFLKDSVSLPFV